MDRTLGGKLQQTVTVEILKFHLVQTSNVASMWELSITCESVVNKPEVNRPHGIDMDGRKNLFFYFYTLHKSMRCWKAYGIQHTHINTVEYAKSNASANRLKLSLTGKHSSKFINDHSEFKNDHIKINANIYK